MIRHLFALTLLATAGFSLLACVPSKAEPYTTADRCALLCQPKSDHPCAGEEIAEDCQVTCEAHVAPLEGDCLTCVMRNSGWLGQRCHCDEVDQFGNVKLSCDDCRYTSLETHCSDGLANGVCSKDSTLCDSFVLQATDGAICGEACGG